MKRTRSRSHRSLIKAAFTHPWAILPEKLEAIAHLLELRAAGQPVGKEDLAAALQERDRRIARSGTGAVAVVNVFGVIAQRMGMLEQASGGSSTEALGRAIDELVATAEVATIVLNVDSPGGSVYGIAELSDKIYAARQKKRIVAIANSQAASAAFWIASAAEELVITPGGMIGSVGVLMMHTDTSQQDEKMGVRHTIHRIPDGKAIGTAGEPLTEEEIDHRRQLIGQYYAMFVEHLARNRGTTTAAVRQQFGGGRMLTAPDALAAGMVNRIVTFDQLVSELLSAGGSQPASGRASAPAFPLKGVLMTPKIFGALVRVGMIGILASEEEAVKALARFFASEGTDDPQDDEKRLAALSAYIARRDAAADAGTTRVAAAEPLRIQQPAATAGTTDDDRAGEIMAAVRMATGITAERKMELAAELIADPKITVSQAVRRISDESAAAAKPSGPTVLPVTPLGSSRDAFTAQARDAILTRTLGGHHPETIWDRRRQTQVEWKPGRFMARLQSLPMLAMECLIMDGFAREQLYGLADWQVAQLAMGVARPEDFGIRAASDGPAYNTSGTFPNLLLDAANVALRMSYDDVANTTYQTWMKRADSVRDFKAVNKVIAGELGDPRAVPEDGEFEEATMSDSKESYKITIWGQIVSITFHAVVNDQLGAFTELPMKQGRAMRRKQNRLAYGVIKDNATMADTGALFNATAQTSAGGHNNLSTGAGAPTVANLNTLTTRMMEMKGLNTANGSALNIMPSWLVACPALRGTVLELLNSTANPAAGGSAAGSSGVANIWQNALRPIIDAELGAAAGGSDTAWYLASAWQDAEHIEYAFLQGMETPVLQQEVAFDRLAWRQRIYQGFAVKAIDYRGLQKHAGA